MNNDSNTNTADTNTSKFVGFFQNYFSQTQKSKSLPDSSDNQNKKSQNLVKDNYPYIYVTRIMSQRKTNYTYRIISLGFYPLNVTKTRRNSINGTVYQIPDDYSFIVTIYKIQITCKTQYQNNLVKYTISWIDHNSETQQYITSYSSATDVSNKFLQKLGKSNKSSISGVKLFAFDLECLEKRRNSQSIDLEKQRSSQQKPLEELSLSQINRRLRSLANNIKDNNNTIELNFQSLVDNFTTDEYLDSIVYAFDDALVSRDSLRRLAAVIPGIDREYLISKRRTEINNFMSNK
ncbi:24147_t:CDS:2, partial [Dentiscutata erythropus]